MNQIFSETKVFHCENNDGYMISESHPQIKPKKELNTYKINSNTLFFIKEFIQQAKIKILNQLLFCFLHLKFIQVLKQNI